MHRQLHVTSLKAQDPRCNVMASLVPGYLPRNLKNMGRNRSSAIMYHTQLHLLVAKIQPLGHSYRLLRTTQTAGVDSEPG